MKAFKIACVGALAGMAFGVCGSAAQAGILFSDLGPGQSYEGKPWIVGGQFTPAFSFVAANSGSVSEIDVALASFQSGSDVVSLWTDGHDALGSELGSWTVSGLPAVHAYSSGHLASITGISGISLTAGDTYYLQVSGADGGWYLNNQNVVGEQLENGAPFFSSRPDGAFDVLSGVPEPATWTMMILGLGMVGFAARRRRESMAMPA